MALALLARNSRGSLSVSAAAAVKIKCAKTSRHPHHRYHFTSDQTLGPQVHLHVLSPACSITNPQRDLADSIHAHVTNNKTPPAASVSRQAGPAGWQPSLQPMQQYDHLAKSISATAAAAKQSLQMMGRAVPELAYTIDCYAATLKQEACYRLKVSPGILDRPDTQRPQQRLAHRCLMALNLDNCQPTLDWMALHPAIGMPLLRTLISTGHADAFGLPVFVEQLKHEFDLDVVDYHALMQQRPHFVGRCLEKYWDDGVTVEPHPFPVIASSELADELLTTGVIESVLGGFGAGRRLLELAQNAGLSTAGRDVTHNSATASWWDLAWSNPCAFLGLLLLSKPLTPLKAFLCDAGRCNTITTPRAATNTSSIQGEGLVGAEVMCGEDGGRGRGCCYGGLTAVGADGDGNTLKVHLLLATERPQESETACLHAEHMPSGLSMENPLRFRNTIFL